MSPLIDSEGVAAWQLNEDLKAAFREGLEDGTNIVVAFAVGVMSGEDAKGLAYVEELDDDPTDKAANMVAYKVGIKAGPLVFRWVTDFIVRSIPVG